MAIILSVSRLLTLLMLIALMIAPCSLVSAAVCRHQSVADHALARVSPNAQVAGAARSEETAASLAKKGTLADAPSASLLADMLPPQGLKAPLRAAEPVRRPLLDDNRLPGTSVRPLLEPPAA